MEKSYKKSIKPETREARYFSTPIDLTLREGTVCAIINKHYLHTSKLRIVVKYDDSDFADQLESIFQSLPVDRTPGRQQFSRSKITFNFPRYLDGLFDSYLKNGSLESVTQQNYDQSYSTLNCGAKVRVEFSVLGTYSKGLLLKVKSIYGEQGLMIDPKEII